MILVTLVKVESVQVICHLTVQECTHGLGYCTAARGISGACTLIVVVTVYNNSCTHYGILVVVAQVNSGIIYQPYVLGITTLLGNT